ncbi:MAG: histidinol-phosphatase [Mycobacteriales bacterium]
MTGTERDLAFAHSLADAADAITLSRFRALDLQVENKPDMTPVSDADRAVEQSLRRLLATRRSGDAVLGEEYGVDGDSPRRWIIDPIDGTKNFVRGVPVWATLIALQVEDEVTVGVASAPGLGRRWWAGRGLSARAGSSLADASALRVSAVGTLEDAALSYSSLGGWAGSGLFDLTRKVWRTRAFGDFWSHVLVAEGAVDISCEPEVSLWDLAALQVIVEEAGGRFTDLAGVARPDRGSVVCSNGLLHEEVLAVLAARR